MNELEQKTEVEKTTLNNPAEAINQNNQVESNPQTPTPFDLFLGRFYDIKSKKYRRGIVENTKEFPDNIVIKNVNDLIECAKYDHTAILFNDDIVVWGEDKHRIKNPTEQEIKEKGKLKKNYRDGKNYVKSNTLFIDVDNDNTENTDEWITPEKFNEMFNQYEYYIINSKSHNIDKTDSKGNIQKARPKFHAYFPLGTYVDKSDIFKNYLKKLTSNYPFFDQSLKDLGRFLYGNYNNLKNSFGIYNQGKSILHLLNTLSIKSVKKNKKEREKKLEKILNVENVCIGKRHYTLIEKGLDLFYQGYNTPELLYPLLVEINNRFETPKEIKPIDEKNPTNEIFDIIKWIIENHPDTYKNGENTFYYTPESIYTYFEDRGYIRCRNNNGNMVYDIKNQTFIPEKSLKQETTKHLCRFWSDEYEKSNISLFWLGDDFNNTNNPFYVIDYRPDLITGKTDINKNGCFIFNTFRGFNAKPIDKKTDCSVIYNHIKNRLCSDNENHYTYFLDWIANLIQKPADYCGTEIILKSKTQGTGKSLFAENFLGERIIGENFSYIGNNEIATDKYTSLLENKVLINFDEVGANDKSQTHSDNIKSIITAKTRSQRFMRQDPVNVPNFLHLITTTNKDWAKRVEISDRRTFMPKMLEERLTPQEADNFIQAIKSDDVCNQFMYDMANRDISKSKLDFPPYSEVLDDQKLQSLDSFNKFLLDLLTGNITTKGINIYDYDFNRFAILKHDFKDLYVNYSKGSNYSKSMAGVEIEKRLREIFGDMIEYNIHLDINAKKYRNIDIPITGKRDRQYCFIFFKDDAEDFLSFAPMYKERFLAVLAVKKDLFLLENIVEQNANCEVRRPSHIATSQNSIYEAGNKTPSNNTARLPKNQQSVRQEEPENIINFASPAPKSNISTQKENTDMNEKTKEKRNYTMPYYDDAESSETSSFGGNSVSKTIDDEPSYVECFMEGRDYLEELEKTIEKHDDKEPPVNDDIEKEIEKLLEAF
jgi:hypothetical protein